MNRTTAAAALTAGALALAGCSSNATTTPATARPVAATPTPQAAPRTTPGEPRTLAAATALAHEQAARYGSGDWTGFYDLLAAADRAVISREDYARYSAVCSAAVPLEVQSVRLDGAGAVARLAVAAMPSASRSYKLIYEHGAWRWHANDMDALRGGARAAVTRAKAAGTCAR